jgi:hypothetical protein
MTVLIRKGLEFSPVTGEPVQWAAAAVPAVTWHAHAMAHAAMKWPSLSAHSPFILDSTAFLWLASLAITH